VEHILGDKVAQIIAIHQGFHNADMEKSLERLQTTGSWKKQRIVYVIPGGDNISPEVYISHRSMIFPPNQPMTPIFIRGAEVGEAFQASVDGILGSTELSSWEYLLTVEHDNIVPQNGVLKLLEAMEKHPEYSAISGLYWTKGEGGVPQIWGDITDPVPNYRPQMPTPGQVLECWGIGMGFALYRMSMFKSLAEKKVVKPWFKTLGKSSDDKGVGTQDLYFWGQVARPNGFRCAVDCSTLVGHIDIKTGVIW
jgi:hypothetical protein